MICKLAGDPSLVQALPVEASSGGQPFASIDAARSWLTAELARRLGLEPQSIAAREPFSHYGLDSAGAVAFAAALANALGRPISPTLLWAYPSVDALATHLVDASTVAGAALGSASGRTALDEPIAIVGMACRFPGASNIAAFRELLVSGKDSVREIPDSRLNVAGYAAGSGPRVPRCAGLLDEVDRFDPLYFGISPREANQIDPQQRLLLELAIEALDDAGLDADKLQLSMTGVFVGAIWRDYGEIAATSGADVTCHTAVGQSLNMIANRLSYVLGLQGPSMVVDTACSSSLVAVHLACQSLRTGDADIALAAGVNLLLSARTLVALAHFGGLAPDGRCKAFDASGDGFGRGEGGGVIVLKRLGEALAHGDRVYAVIRGTAVNNDGPSNGLNAPNPKAQEQVIAAALLRSGLAPRRVCYVEAHGTGTMLGDPIEASALGAVLGERSRSAPLRVGSVKTNLGHLEGAAGIAGLIKAVLSVERRVVFPSLHFHTPNPHIPFEALGITVPTVLEPWPEVDGPAVAGVSSFGWGGTNAHVIVEQAALEPVALLGLAASDEAELRALALRTAGRLEVEATTALEAFSARASDENASGAARLALTARSAGALREAIEQFARGEPTPEVLAARAPERRPKLVFVCSPQGGQWVGMARALLATEPVFRATLERVDAALRVHAGWSLCDELMRSETEARFDDVDVIQPIIFGIQIALAEQLRAYGIEPDAVVGHSLGEIAAAFIAGVLELTDAVRVVYHYSRLQRTTVSRWGMAIVELASDELEASIRSSGAELSIAAHNGPRSTVVSGDERALEALLAELKARGVRCSLIRVNVAAHGAAMDPILADLVAALDGIRPRRAARLWLSSMTAVALEGPELEARYFADNLRQKVLLREALEGLLASEHALFVEIGPAPVLLQSLKQTLDGRAEALAALTRGSDERVALYQLRARLFALGWPLRGAPCALLLPLAARAPEALHELPARLKSWLIREPDAVLEDLCRTAARRTHHPHRIACVAASRAELVAALEGLSRGEAEDGVVVGSGTAASPQRVAFVFPGQGSQWIGMGRALLRSERSFREAFMLCDAQIVAQNGWSAATELEATPETSRLQDIDVVQPLLFAVEVALAAQWQTWGIRPDVVIGHSMGEVAAAHVAGVLSLEDAARIICLRSRLMRSLSGRGAMLATELTLEQARELVRGKERGVSVAVSNSARSTVLSGDRAVLEEIAAELDVRGVFRRWIKVDVASHSPQMDVLASDLLASLAGISPRQASIAMYSTVLDRTIEGSELGSEYWLRNLREPVLFGSAVQRACADGVGAFVEMSPHPILLPAIEQGLEETGRVAVAVPSLRREDDARRVMLGSLARLYVAGCTPDWEAVHRFSGSVIALPEYPWQREAYWFEPGGAPPGRSVARADGHPLLGDHLESRHERGTHYFEAELRRESLPFVADHVMDGEVIAPGSLFVEAALAAAARVEPGREHALVQVKFERPLRFPEAGPCRVQWVLTPRDPGVRVLAYFEDSAEGEPAWALHASAMLESDLPAPPSAVLDLAAFMAGSEHVLGEPFYAELVAHGLDYGRRLQGIRELWRRPGEALARLVYSEDTVSEAAVYALHPAFVDTALQVALGTLSKELRPEATCVTVALESVRVHAAIPRECFSHARRRPVTSSVGIGVDVVMLDADGRRVLSVEGMEVRILPRRAIPGVVVSASTGQRSASLKEQLLAQVPAQRRRTIEAGIREITASVLRLQLRRVALDVPLRTLGLDSVMSLELRNRLERKFSIRLSATVIWNHPTIREIAGIVAREMQVPLEESDRGASPGAPEAAPLTGGEPGVSATELLLRELAKVDELMKEVS